MQRKTRFLLNGSLLAGTSLALRLVQLAFSAYITVKLGAEGTGLISLVNTVYGFGITLAVSGISLASMRLCADAVGKRNHAALTGAVRRCILYAGAFGFGAFCLLFFSADAAGTRFLGDARTVESIRTLAFALPFLSMSTVFDGYFAAVGRVYKSAAADICEQCIKILFTLLLLRSTLPGDTQATVLAVTKGSCIGELFSFLLALLLYVNDKKRHISPHGNPMAGQTRSMCRIALPVAFSTYARSGLVTVEHALIPRGLRASGASAATALADYGVVRGMALPIVLFPAAILSSFTGLLVPLFAEDIAAGNRHAIDRKASASLNAAASFSVLTAVSLFSFGKPLGKAVYKNETAGVYIRLFALLIPFMYCDTTADAMLKGLDKQMYTMLVNIADAACSVLLTWRLVPKTGLPGYICTVFITEILNFACSAGKLATIVKLTLQPVRTLLFPAGTAAGAAAGAKLLLRFLHIKSPAWTAGLGLCMTAGTAGGAVLMVCYPEALRAAKKLCTLRPSVHIAFSRLTNTPRSILMKKT